MSKKRIGQVAAVLGGAVAILSLAANPLGLGSNPSEFGWLQTLGAVVGVLTMAGGIWLAGRN